MESDRKHRVGSFFLMGLVGYDADAGNLVRGTNGDSRQRDVGFQLEFDNRGGLRKNG